MGIVLKHEIVAGQAGMKKYNYSLPNAMGGHEEAMPSHCSTP